MPPHVCHRSNCASCILNRNDVTVFNIKIVIPECCNETVKTYNFPKDLEVHIDSIMCMAVKAAHLLAKHGNTTLGKIKKGSAIFLGDDLHVMHIEKTEKKETFVFSWVTYPKAAEIMMHATPDSDDSDDPTVTV